MSRLRQLPLKWFAAGGAVVLIVVGVTFLLTDGGHAHRTTDSLGTDVTPTDTTLAIPTETSLAVPSETPSLIPTPDTLSTQGPSATPEPTDTGLPARCQGPLPPGATADASCDAMDPHPGLPHPCIGPRYACAWPDAHGAVPAGPYDPNIVVHGTDVHVTWTTNAQDLHGDRYAGPVHEFVIRLLPADSDTVLATRELPTSTYSTTFENLAPGTYTICIQELNDSGLSAGFGPNVTVPAPATPTPSATPSPTSPETPGPSPSA